MSQHLTEQVTVASASLSLLEKFVADLSHKRDTLLSSQGMVGLPLTTAAQVAADKAKENDIMLEDYLCAMKLRTEALHKVKTSIEASLLRIQVTHFVNSCCLEYCCMFAMQFIISWTHAFHIMNNIIIYFCREVYNLWTVRKEVYKLFTVTKM